MSMGEALILVGCLRMLEGKCPGGLEVPFMQGMRVSEFVMSNELVSMTLAMVSESREVNTILKELFTPEGNELCIHPAARYLR